MVVENLYSANGDLFRVQHGFEQVEKRIGQITVLPNGSTNSEIEEALLAKFHVKTRNAIRKGLKFNQDIALDKSTEAWEWLGWAHGPIVALEVYQNQDIFLTAYVRAKLNTVCMLGVMWTFVQQY